MRSHRLPTLAFVTWIAATASSVAACSPYADRIFPPLDGAVGTGGGSSGSGGNHSGGAGGVGTGGALMDGSSMDVVEDVPVGPVCGNGMKEEGETCDDGHTDVCGECNADCSGPGNFKPPADCRCADGTIEQDFTVGTTSGVTMVGCADVKNNADAGVKGTAWADRVTLCGKGCKVCTAPQWMGLHPSGTIKEPTFNYWTDDVLVQTAGTMSQQCSVSTSNGVDMGLCAGRPMRVCKHWPIDERVTDNSGTTCDIHDCTFGMAASVGATNFYFGGCVNNFTAGALCCCN